MIRRIWTRLRDEFELPLLTLALLACVAVLVLAVVHLARNPVEPWVAVLFVLPFVIGGLARKT